MTNVIDNNINPEGSIIPGISLNSSQSGNAVDQRKLEIATRDFEALFMSYMLKVMRGSESEEAGGLSLGKNNPLQDIFDWELAKDISAKNPLGIADQMMQQIFKDESDETNSAEKLIPFDMRSLIVHYASMRNASSKLDLKSMIGIIEKASFKYDLDPDLIHSVIEIESAGDPSVISNKGAKGLMQLMDSTASEMGVKNPFNPQQNIFGGAKYLRKMLDRYDGDTTLALAAYNAGPGAVDKYKGIPPFTETQDYVSKVFQNYSEKIATKNNNYQEKSGENNGR